jgi:hypothetical protein
MDLSGLPYKPRGELLFRMDTPSMGLKGKGGLMANLFVQIGDCQKQLQHIGAQYII